MAGIYKRGSTYWGRAQRDGREHRFSLRTTNKGIAEKRLRKWLDDMDATAWGEKPPRQWQQVWERFMKEHFPTIKPTSAKRYAVQDDVIKRARELWSAVDDCAYVGGGPYSEAVEWQMDAALDIIARALMEERAAERERCAKLVERDAMDNSVRLDTGKYRNMNEWFAAQRAAAIRGQP